MKMGSLGRNIARSSAKKGKSDDDPFEYCSCPCCDVETCAAVEELVFGEDGDGTTWDLLKYGVCPVEFDDTQISLERPDKQMRL